MSRIVSRLFARPACIAGVLTSMISSCQEKKILLTSMISSCQEKKILLTRATEERVTSTLQNPQLAIVPLGEGSCLTQNQTSICCLGPVWPSQKIEFVFPASLETSRGGLGSIPLRRPVRNRRDLAGCALKDPVVIFSAAAPYAAAGR